MPHDRATPEVANAALPARGFEGTAPRLAISAIVTTYNEEANIAACLDSLSWCDEILVVDSFSEDRTSDIVRSHARAQLVQRRYVGAAFQKNWAIERTAHDWILILDADERCTAELRAEIEGLLATDPESSAFRIRRRVHFLGRVLRFSGWQHDRVVRLFKKGFASYPNRRVHGDMVSCFPPRLLDNVLEHYMAPDFHRYGARIYKYAYWGATDAWRNGKTTGVLEICFRPAWRFLRTLHGFEEKGSTNFLVMELVDGETLADRIKRGAIPVDEAIPLFLQIAEGLEAAHEKGVIHRDLKLANIKVSEDGTIKILDFGLAKGRRGNNFTLSPERVRPRRHRAVAALEVVVS